MSTERVDDATTRKTTLPKTAPTAATPRWPVAPTTVRSAPDLGGDVLELLPGRTPPKE